MTRVAKQCMQSFRHCLQVPVYYLSTTSTPSLFIVFEPSILLHAAVGPHIEMQTYLLDL